MKAIIIIGSILFSFSTFSSTSVICDVKSSQIVGDNKLVVTLDGTGAFTKDGGEVLKLKMFMNGAQAAFFDECSPIIGPATEQFYRCEEDDSDSNLIFFYNTKTKKGKIHTIDDRNFLAKLECSQA